MNDGAYGVVLLAHGSRVPEANAGVFELAAALVRRLPGVPVRPCFLVRGEPDPAAAVSELVGLGLRRIIILPFFLSSGRHVQEDIPHLVEEARRRHPRVEFTLAPTLGLDERLVEILVARLREVLRGVPAGSPGH